MYKNIHTSSGLVYGLFPFYVKVLKNKRQFRIIGALTRHRYELAMPRLRLTDEPWSKLCPVLLQNSL